MGGVAGRNRCPQRRAREQLQTKAQKRYSLRATVLAMIPPSQQLSSTARPQPTETSILPCSATPRQREPAKAKQASNPQPATRNPTAQTNEPTFQERKTQTGEMDERIGAARMLPTSDTLLPATVPLHHPLSPYQPILTP